MLKSRFGLKTQNNSGNVTRKPGMSIINPMSKRRKAPKGGVKFDEEEEIGEEEVDE